MTFKPGLFVTGTDTGVGKTYVAAALVRAARAQSERVFAFKPIETGCREGGLGDDQRALCLAAGDWQSERLQGVYRFRDPVAPRVAAAAEGIVIDLDQIMVTYRQGLASSTFVIVEGAGGWRVPLNDADDMAALARKIGLPVLVVARAGLGTINHSLLTIEAIERDRCSIAGAVLSRRPDEDLDFALQNADEIRARWPGSVEVTTSEIDLHRWLARHRAAL